MIAKQACPRCRGTLTLVEDVGDSYYSCVQCGNTLYENPSNLTALPVAARWECPAVADRSAVRRRLIAKERARSGRPAAA